MSKRLTKPFATAGRGLLTAILLSAILPAQAVDSRRAAELENLLLQDCGSCHGMRLTGGLGPSLERAALAPRGASWVRHVIAAGVPGTPMPPWRGLLSDAEIDWLVAYLLGGDDS